MVEPTNPEPYRLDLTVETRLGPSGVMDSLLDFSEQRLRTWARSLDPTKYRLEEQGDGWAIVTEGSPEPDIYARERYEWSATTITATVLESDFCLPGGYVRYRVHPAEDGGSRVDVTWSRRPSGPAYQPMFDAMPTDGLALIRTHLRDTWDRLAGEA